MLDEELNETRTQISLLTAQDYSILLDKLFNLSRSRCAQLLNLVVHNYSSYLALVVYKITQSFSLSVQYYSSYLALGAILLHQFPQSIYVSISLPLFIYSSILICLSISLSLYLPSSYPIYLSHGYQTDLPPKLNNQ